MSREEKSEKKRLLPPYMGAEGNQMNAIAATTRVMAPSNMSASDLTHALPMAKRYCHPLQPPLPARPDMIPKASGPEHIPAVGQLLYPSSDRHIDLPMLLLDQKMAKRKLNSVVVYHRVKYQAMPGINPASPAASKNRVAKNP